MEKISNIRDAGLNLFVKNSFLITFTDKIVNNMLVIKYKFVFLYHLISLNFLNELLPPHSVEILMSTTLKPFFSKGVIYKITSLDRNLEFIM